MTNADELNKKLNIKPKSAYDSDIIKNVKGVGKEDKEGQIYPIIEKIDLFATGDSRSTVEVGNIEFNDEDNSWTNTVAMFTSQIDFSKYESLEFDVNLHTDENTYFGVSLYQQIIQFEQNNWSNSLKLLNSSAQILYSTNNTGDTNQHIKIDLSDYNNISRIYFWGTSGINTIPFDINCINNLNGYFKAKFNAINIFKKTN